MDDKTLHIQTDFIQQDGKDTFYNHRYEPTPYDVLDNLFSVLLLSRTAVWSTTAADRAD